LLQLEERNALDRLQLRCHKIAKDHGFWDVEQSVGDRLTHIHAEISEAWEEYRKGLNEHRFYIVNGKPEGFGVELADAVIRILDLAEGLELDLWRCIDEKLEYNATRPRLHGKTC